MPLNLSRVVNSPRLAMSFTILRSNGAFAYGGYQANDTQIPAYGILCPDEEMGLDQIPVADRINGSIHLFTQAQLYVTHADPQNASGLSDKVQWNGATYRIVSLGPWRDNGFWHAILLRLPGQ